MQSASLQRIIWLASFPKSGNTWTRIFLANLLMPKGQVPDINHLYKFTTADVRQDFFDQAAGRPFVAEYLDEWLAMRPKALAAIAASKPGHHFVKTHSKIAFAGDIPLIPPEVTAAAIYIVRNPFDVVLSYARHLSTSIDETIDQMCDPHATNATKTGIAEMIGRWDAHVESWTTAPGLSRYVMRYEDMIDDPERAFRGLIGYLKIQVSDGQLRRAIRAASFDSLQKQERQKGFRERPDGMEAFFAKGKSGGWRTDLTQAQIGRLRTEFADTLATFYPELVAETAALEE